MELYQLRTFLTVANEENLTRAAARLYSSQPTVSAHIKALEEDLRVKLFHRTSKGMKLTNEGEMLKRKAEQVLEAASELQTTAKHMQDQISGQVRIGVNTDGDQLRLSTLLDKITIEHPQIELQFIQETSGIILENLQHELLDCGYFFGNNPHSEIEHLTLEVVSFVIAIPARWREQMSDANWEALAALPWIIPAPECPYIEIFNKMELVPKKIAYASSEPAINALVTAGSGVSIIRKDHALRMEAEGEIMIWNQNQYTLPLCFGYLSSRAGDPIIAVLKERVAAIWGD